MLKETIKYTDCNGVERTEDFWFHLSKADRKSTRLNSSHL